MTADRRSASAREDEAKQRNDEERQERQADSYPGSAVQAPRLGILGEHLDEKLMIFAGTAAHACKRTAGGGTGRISAAMHSQEHAGSGIMQSLFS